MHCFLVTLLLILVVGVVITQLILLEWTDSRLWNVLHACLFFVSIHAESVTFVLVVRARDLASLGEGRGLGCLPLQFKDHHEQPPLGPQQVSWQLWPCN